MVFFDRVGTDLEATKVMLDNYDGAVQAVSHLIEQGCRRIAYLAGPANLSISNQRKKGYLGTLEKYGLPVREELIMHCEFDREHAYRATLRLLDGAERPDAIFAVSDRIAVGALLALRERGVRRARRSGAGRLQRRAGGRPAHAQPVQRGPAGLRDGAAGRPALHRANEQRRAPAAQNRAA